MLRTEMKNNYLYYNMFTSLKQRILGCYFRGELIKNTVHHDYIFINGNLLTI